MTSQLESIEMSNKNQAIAIKPPTNTTKKETRNQTGVRDAGSILQWAVKSDAT